MRAAQACSGSRGAAWVAPQRAPPASGRRRVPRALPDAQDADAALFAQLVQQASVRPAARVAQRVLQPDPWHAAAEAPAAAAAAAAVTAPRALAAPARRPHPARMPFDAMYTQLAAWRARYLSCHVPRFCFDAPVLGAWVRWLRKEHKEQRLERWKMDRLNLLDFEWQLTDADAKWYNSYHQLRRFKAIHGHTRLPADYRSREDRDWVRVARWLRRQGQLLAAQKLPSRRRDMLAALGVTLAVPKQLVVRISRLQGLNGHERKLERRRWKVQDARRAERQELEQEQLRQQEAAAAQLLVTQQERRLLLRQQLPGSYRVPAAGSGAGTLLAGELPSSSGAGTLLAGELPSSSGAGTLLAGELPSSSATSDLLPLNTHGSPPQPHAPDAQAVAPAQQQLAQAMPAGVALEASSVGGMCERNGGGLAARRRRGLARRQP